ncbi:MAG: DUF86 domain-containing protein [Oscillospiraceae bacterium]|nr:DUF86 domain-containing protein [Oscillospiraceae bacterium]
MNERDLTRIRYIKEYCDDITATIARCGNDEQKFRSDRDYYNSVSMSLMQIGELSKSLSPEFIKETENQIPWHKVRGMRNWFAHSYQKMSKTTMWETATKSIPSLLAFCEQAIPQQ